jgi:hypothetical protein
MQYRRTLEGSNILHNRPAQASIDVTPLFSGDVPQAIGQYPPSRGIRHRIRCTTHQANPDHPGGSADGLSASTVLVPWAAITSSPLVTVVQSQNEHDR